ncbi:MAG: AmmeMemoRadiSam system protein A [Ignavibacteriaceae bacterium]
MNLSEEEKQFLLTAARNSIRSQFENISLPEPDYTIYPNLKANAGAFVTLTSDGSLRGCIGFIVSDKPLYETVCDAAVHAAFEDPRFVPLSKNELSRINIEISVLSPPAPVQSYDEIQIGKHGLILNERHRALLLPQVATEHNMNRDEFLSALCEKAGIDKFTWKQRKLNLMVFTADVFSEKERSKV